jgi:hypothetical protein
MPPGLETAFLGFLTFVAGQVILKLMDPALEPKKLIGRIATLFFVLVLVYYL